MTSKVASELVALISIIVPAIWLWMAASIIWPLRLLSLVEPLRWSELMILLLKIHSPVGMNVISAALVLVRRRWLGTLS